MAITQDFNAIANGTLLDAAGLGYTKLVNSSANTISINNGALDFTGTATFATYAYETGQTVHSFGAKYSTSGGGGGYFAACVRIVDYRNMIWARINPSNQLEIGTCINAALTVYPGGTFSITRTANDVVKLSANGNVITCYLNGTQMFQVTDSTFNTATKIGMCARANTNTNVITEVVLDFVSVTSINGGSAIPAGKTGVGAVTAAFTGLPSTITTNASGVTCSNIGGTTNAPTFDLSDRVDGGFYPKDGTSVNFTFTNGSEVATGAQTVSKKATETKVVLASPVTDNTTYFAGAVLDQTGRTLATGDEVYLIPYSDLVMDTNSGITVTDAGTFTCWVYINSGTDAGKNYFYSVQVAAGGAVISVTGLTQSGLTTSGLTISGLTKAGL